MLQLIKTSIPILVSIDVADNAHDKVNVDRRSALLCHESSEKLGNADRAGLALRRALWQALPGWFPPALAPLP